MKTYKPIGLGFCSQKFGENKVPFYKQLNMLGHNGIDWGCQIGTPIHWNGSKRGTVTRVVSEPTKGMGVYIRCEDNLYVFWHTSENLVQAGDEVESGDLIAKSGNSGLYTTGPHLHWGWYKIDPNGNILNRDNGYGGAIDPINEDYTDVFIVDYKENLKKQLANLTKQVSIWQKIVEIMCRIFKGRC